MARAQRYPSTWKMTNFRVVEKVHQGIFDPAESYFFYSNSLSALLLPLHRYNAPLSARAVYPAGIQLSRRHHNHICARAKHLTLLTTFQTPYNPLIHFHFLPSGPSLPDFTSFSLYTSAAHHIQHFTLTTYTLQLPATHVPLNGSPEYTPLIMHCISVAAISTGKHRFPSDQL